jgi:hypothetical protein
MTSNAMPTDRTTIQRAVPLHHRSGVCEAFVGLRLLECRRDHIQYKNKSQPF